MENQEHEIQVINQELREQDEYLASYETFKLPSDFFISFDFIDNTNE